MADAPVLWERRSEPKMRRSEPEMADERVPWSPRSEPEMADAPTTPPATDKKVQLTAYAKVDAIHRWPKRHSGLPVLVQVVAPPEMGDRTPIDLVAVLDVSCGGLPPTNTQDLLKEAMALVIGKLNDKDRLAIVPVQTSLAEQTNLMVMTAAGRTKASEKVKSLAVTGDKKLSTALKKAKGILDGRDKKESSVGFIILISDGDEASIFRENINLNYSVHAFGFRDAHNIRAMHHIANNSTGTYGILNDEHDRITEAFKASISKITSVVAVQTEVYITCSSMATLSAIESGRFNWHIEDQRKRGYVEAGDLHAGAVRNFIVYVDNVSEDEYNDLPKQFTLRFRCHRASSRVQESLDGQVFAVRKGIDGSKEVAAEIVRVEAVNIVGDILRKYDDKGKALVEAVDELRMQWLRLKDSEYGREAGEACLISGLAAEMQEMETSMRRCSGLSYMLSWQTCHTLQHQKSTTVTPSAAKRSPQAPAPAQVSPPKRMVDRTPVDKFVAAGAHAKAGTDSDGESRKRKHQHNTELEMIEQRLAYWSKVKCDLPPMLHDGPGDYPDQITMVFREASSESIDRAMFHDVFLAVVHATGRRGSYSSKSVERSSDSATENLRHLDSCMG